MSNEHNIDEKSQQLSPEQTRRKFLNKFGKLAVVTPIAVSALISPTTSAAPSSDWCAQRPNHRKCR